MSATPAPPSVPRPPAVSSAHWIAVGLTVAVLLLINVVYASRQQDELGATSYGKAGSGFGALYDLLHELGLGVSRSQQRYGAVPIDRTLWLLLPSSLDSSPLERLGKRSDRASPEAGSAAPAQGGAEAPAKPSPDRDPTRSPTPEAATDPQAAALLAWIERGGTALLFGELRSDWSAYGLPQATAAPIDAPKKQRSSGLSTRTLNLGRSARFERTDDAALEALLEVDGAPFIVRKQIGAGRLIAIASAKPFTNAELDAADHSLLALDLVEAFGTPTLDEFCHGYGITPSLLAALRPGRSLLLACGFGLLAALWLWRSRVVPAELRVPKVGIDPGLRAFVDSLSALYSRQVARHAPAIARAYQQGVRHRLQRAATRRGPARVPHAAASLARTGEDEVSAQAAPPRNHAELERAVRMMEQRVAELAGSHGARTGRRGKPSHRQEPLK